MNPLVISSISACTALVASVVGPLVSLTVSKRQIRANVVSANREKWMETLRDVLAELVSLLASAVVVRARWHGKWQQALGPAAEDAVYLEKVERVTLAMAQVRLLLNPNEPDCQRLCEAIEGAIARLRSEDSTEAETRADILTITRFAQIILKREWERVKRGT